MRLVQHDGTEWESRRRFLRVAALREAVSIEDFKEVMVMLITRAKEGDLRAARIIMEQVLGKVRGVLLELEGEGWPL